MKRLTCTGLLLLSVVACSARGGGGGGGVFDSDGSVDDTTAPSDNPTAADAPKGADVPVTTNDAPVTMNDVPVTSDVPVAPDVPVTTDVPVTPDVPTNRCASDRDCVGAQFCGNDGMCRAIVCTPRSVICSTATRLRVCDERGSMVSEMDCPGGAPCVDGRCQSPMMCTPNARSCASPAQAQVCSPDGTTYLPSACPTGPNATARCEGAGTCTLACSAGFSNCNMLASDGCEAAVSSDPANCGSCGRACAAGQSCVSGACTGGGGGGNGLQILSLGATGCVAREHAGTTGDDHGGIAVGSTAVFYAGDNNTGRFDLDTLTGTSAMIYDGLVSNLRTGAVYTFGTGSAPFTPLTTPTSFTSLVEINQATGAPTGTFITLSTPIPYRSGGTGFFAGSDRVAVHSGGVVYEVSLPSGTVTNRGAVMLRAPFTCEGRGDFWGVAEFYGGALRLAYVSSSPANTVQRTRVSDGLSETVATLTNLSDMCSFTVSPARNRWYFHHEGSSQFTASLPSADEVIGYCNATISTTGGGTTCTAPQVDCGGTCVDTSTDPANCGACGRACTAGMTCRAGTCTTTTTGGRYARTTPPSSVFYVDACTLTGATRYFAAGTDDSSMTATLPFAFNYWGRLTSAGSMVGVSSNGFLNIGSAGDSSTSGTIPSTGAPNGVVAPYWRDLIVGTNVCVATTGSAGNRQMVFTWPNMRLYSGTGNFSATVILYELDGAIDFLYQGVTVASTSTATVGLENQAGTDAIGGCAAGTTCPITSSTRVRFVPAP